MRTIRKLSRCLSWENENENENEKKNEQHVHEKKTLLFGSIKRKRVLQYCSELGGQDCVTILMNTLDLWYSRLIVRTTTIRTVPTGS